MHPVLKRTLVQGGLTAALLALVGVAFTELTGVWNLGGTRPGAEDLNPKLPDALRYRIPLTMAAAGFLFVALGELALWRMCGNKPPPTPTKAAEQPADDAEKLLNELLAQAEAKMAAEAAAKATGDGQQAAGESGEQKPEDSQMKAEGGEKTPEAR
jgi:hypothetical protein